MAGACLLGSCASTSPAPTVTVTSAPSSTPPPTFAPPSATSTATVFGTATATLTASPVGVPVAYLMVAGGYASARVSTCYVGTVHDNGDVLAWTTGPVLPYAPAYAAMAAAGAGSFVYAAAGDSGAGAMTCAYAGTVGGGGAITAWNATTPVPYPASAYPAYTTDGAGTLYLAGGYTDFNFVVTISDAFAGSYSAGAFTSWSTAPLLPVSLAEGALAHQGGFLFHAGGWDGSAGTTAVYRAAAAGQAVSAWSSVSPPLPVPRTGAAGFSAGGRVFVVGGRSGGSSAPPTSTIYSAAASAGTLSPWTTSSAGIPVAKAEMSYAVLPLSFAGTVYVVGGYLGGTTMTDQVQAASFAGGVLGSWTTTLPYPVPINDHAAAF